MKTRTFGIDATALTLSDLAMDIYSTTDPLDITEIRDEDDNVLYYELSGCLDATGLTEEDVNDYLESLAQYRVKPEHLSEINGVYQYLFSEKLDLDTDLDRDDIENISNNYGDDVSDMFDLDDGFFDKRTSARILEKLEKHEIGMIDIDQFPDIDLIDFVEVQSTDISQGTGNVIVRLFYIPALNIVCRYTDF